LSIFLEDDPQTKVLAKPTFAPSPPKGEKVVAQSREDVPIPSTTFNTSSRLRHGHHPLTSGSLTGTIGNHV